MIEKISGLAALSNLKILSLARNNIKTFAGLDVLAGTLEELWISYNIIEKMKGLSGMHKLKVLYMSNNNIDDWSEVQKLNELESLQDLELVGKELLLNSQQTFYDHLCTTFYYYSGNPLCESMDESIWRSECTRKLPKIAILDGIPTAGRE